MTTTTKKHVFRAPNGVELEIEPDSDLPFSLEKFIEARDEWLAKYGDFVKGYSMDLFLQEKHEDIDKDLL